MYLYLFAVAKLYLWTKENNLGSRSNMSIYLIFVIGAVNWITQIMIARYGWIVKEV